MDYRTIRTRYVFTAKDGLRDKEEWRRTLLESFLSRTGIRSYRHRLTNIGNRTAFIVETDYTVWAKKCAIEDETLKEARLLRKAKPGTLLGADSCLIDRMMITTHEVEDRDFCDGRVVL